MNATVPIIDSDVRHALKNPNELLPFLKEPWKHQVKQFGFRSPRTYGPPQLAHIDRAYTPKDEGAAADPERLHTFFLEAYGIGHAVLTGAMYGISVHSDPDYSAALAAAYNDHLLERWLPRSEKYKGAMTVATQDPQLAAMEIDRVGAHPDIVQISIGSGSQAPYGQRYYAPIFEAASRRGLPVAIHAGTEGGGIAGPPTAAGYVSDYLQFHTASSHSLMAHAISLIGEGVFERYPTLKIVLAGGGVSWLPHLMWRMDRSYRELKALVPTLKRKPSEYMRDHLYVTTQPIDESDSPEPMRQLLEMTDAENMLLFASGYPGWDFDDPARILPGLSGEARNRVLYGNAKRLFRL
ncbi:amidohydrolase family protein [Paenibacillus ginsengarvi]|uniref:Amidohydrolase n=1 Tax=Paenibacillus ginsengarvi TaxID=400777 RepID=A0A3B0BLQ3_9BACL|nr:amidohydrolase family protein [Paenibacillus ginsengarvi]RKN74122.1 amidohydrolase [Paenibacillus ginsengarvi]